MLPTQKTPPKPLLSDLTVLVYGKNKFGKTTLCSHADGALFLATEAGLNSLEVFQVPIGNWEELLVAAREIAEGKHQFKTIIVDTVDNAYRMCCEHMNHKLKVEHESDLGYGKGYSLINSEFYRVLNKLALLPYGLMLVSHAQDKEIETRTGKITRTIPTLPDKARKLVLGLVDIIAYCDFEPTTNADGKAGYRRVIRTKPSATYEAGDRTGRLPEVIDFDFQAFAAAVAGGRGAIPLPATTGSSSSNLASETPARVHEGAATASSPAAPPPAATPSPAATPASAATSAPAVTAARGSAPPTTTHPAPRATAPAGRPTPERTAKP